MVDPKLPEITGMDLGAGPSKIGIAVFCHVPSIDSQTLRLLEIISKQEAAIVYVDFEPSEINIARIEDLIRQQGVEPIDESFMLKALEKIPVLELKPDRKANMPYFRRFEKRRPK